VKPRLVLSRQKPGGPVEQFPAEKPERIIAPETAIQMRGMMEGVVLRGTAKGFANLRGYTSAGKTGTAQIFDFKSRVYTHRYNASFLGFAPVENPQIVIIVTLEGTTGGTAGFGAPVAAPVFREVAMAALRMLDVPKDLPETPVVAASAPAGATNLADPVSRRSVSSVTPPPVQGDASALPGTFSSLKEGNPDRRHFLTSSLAEPSRGGPSSAGPASAGLAGNQSKVPDFSGMSLRAVLEESSAAGLEVEVDGSGLARSQVPSPGTDLRPHARVRVQFAK
jgi:cell division protein FtsI (penicillin-binding protein 3)